MDALLLITILAYVQICSLHKRKILHLHVRCSPRGYMSKQCTIYLSIHYWKRGAVRGQMEYNAKREITLTFRPGLFMCA